MSNTIKFWLDGCDISFLAEAPEDITLKDLLKQCDRIEPDWCACGLRSYYEQECGDVELVFTKNDVIKTDENVTCRIHDDCEWYYKKYIE